MIKELLKSLAGEPLLGVYDYFRKPELLNHWGGAFNGQKIRSKAIIKILSNLNISHAIETGSYRGDTTAFFAAHCQKTQTVELMPRNFGFVLGRFLFNRNVQVIKSDSREFLQTLAGSTTRSENNVLFYLDAHWQDDLPLAEEVSIIAKNWQNFVVIVDDFKVPDDDYGYDDYGYDENGKGKALNLEYLQAVDGFDKFHLFFPSKSADEESGAKRGWVVITDSTEMAQKLGENEYLRHYP